MIVIPMQYTSALLADPYANQVDKDWPRWFHRLFYRSTHTKGAGIIGTHMANTFGPKMQAFRDVGSSYKKGGKGNAYTAERLTFFSLDVERSWNQGCRRSTKLEYIRYSRHLIEAQALAAISILSEEVLPNEVFCIYGDAAGFVRIRSQGIELISQAQRVLTYLVQNHLPQLKYITTQELSHTEKEAFVDVFYDAIRLGEEHY